MTSPVRQQPNKVLGMRVTEKFDLEAWPYEDFPGDPYWQGGSTPKPYRWILKMNVSAQTHGDPSTREPFRYNGVDIFVGDWISDDVLGFSLKVISISEKTTNSATIVVEDVDRYNTFMSETGDGLFSIPGDGIIYEISDERMPILNPLPSSLTSFRFSGEITARFQNNNPLYRYRFSQPNHTLSDNDAVWVDSGDGEIKTVSNSDNMKVMIGTVDRVGPGDDIFYIIPSTKIVEGIDPPLPGTAGVVVYIDSSTGEFTTVESGKAAYIQVTNTVPDETRSNASIVTQGNILGVNDVGVTFTGTTLQSVVDDINLLTSQHRVTAILVPGPNTALTDQGQLSYGICACIGIATVASINGTTVAFNDDTNGTIEFGSSAVNAVDMANAINSAVVPNITATGHTSVQLTIENATGAQIDIINIAGDDGAIPFAGNASCSGIPLSTPPGGEDFIELTNNSGNGIILTNALGQPVFELDIPSVRNGELPKGLVVEQFVTETSTGTKVYATMAELPASAIVGEQAFVIDSADGQGNKAGEWTMFLWDGFQWVKTSDEDSAHTDARTLQAIVAFDGPGIVPVGTLSDSRRVTSVVVEIITTFDGTPDMNIGDTTNPTSLMTNDHIDLTIIGSYSVNPDFRYNTGNDVDIIVTLNAGGATKGNALITVTYV